MNFNTDLNPKRKDICGQHSVTISRVDRKIRDICIQNRKLPISILTKQIQDVGIKISQRTVQWQLTEEGLLAKNPAQKPELIPAMIRNRQKSIRIL